MTPPTSSTPMRSRVWSWLSRAWRAIAGDEPGLVLLIAAMVLLGFLMTVLEWP